MSTKRSILCTPDDEHWYVEYVEYDNGECPVYLEIKKENFIITKNDDENIVIRIRGDSEMAIILKRANIEFEDRFPDHSKWLEEQKDKYKKKKEEYDKKH